jgi:molecular chaperone DnaJ
LGTDNAYAELGLSFGASETEVKRAWRRLVSMWHPDRNASAAAVGKIQRINRAFEEIRQAGFAAASDDQAAAAQGHSAKNESPRQRDDSEAQARRRHGKARPQPFDEKPDPGRDHRNDSTDFDADRRASAARPEPDAACRTICRKVKLTLEDAAAGCIKVLRGKLSGVCTACAGVGYKTVAGACSACAGTGSVRQRTWYGWAGLATECEACRGDGRARRACTVCAGQGDLGAQGYKIKVRIPHGVRGGDVLHVDSSRPPAGQPALKLDLRIAVSPHPFFELDDDGTIRCEVPVDGFAWIANRSVDVPTLTGLHRLSLSRDLLSYRLNGLGFPVERRGRPGDQLVKLAPLFPDRLSTDQEILLDQLIATSSRDDAGQSASRLHEWNQALRGWDGERAKRQAD